MPRQARTQSSTEIYHILIQGINHQKLFQEAEDNEKFIRILTDCKAISRFKLYGYYLMDDHAHLLIKAERETTEQILKRIGGRYIYWFNNKYRREGHLFQDRYKSEPVEDENYLLTVLRYIHQNPVKAGLAETAEEYPLSSYHEYMHPKENQLTDIEYVLSIMNLKRFKAFHNVDNDDNCMDVKKKEYRPTDDQATAIMQKISNCASAAEFDALPFQNRDMYIAQMKREGLSLRQISRITGVSLGIVRKISSCKDLALIEDQKC